MEANAAWEGVWGLDFLWLATVWVGAVGIDFLTLDAAPLTAPFYVDVLPLAGWDALAAELPISFY